VRKINKNNHPSTLGRIMHTAALGFVTLLLQALGAKAGPALGPTQVNIAKEVFFTGFICVFFITVYPPPQLAIPQEMCHNTGSPQPAPSTLRGQDYN